ncbi:hypothetical protein [Streptomyces sp. NPDC058644]|uniref:hypothetical protein n=1 Tax=unclassified Streptomyces TaxID=2593676 RepID=UPI003654489F
MNQPATTIRDTTTATGTPPSPTAPAFASASKLSTAAPPSATSSQKPRTTGRAALKRMAGNPAAA